MALAVVLAEVSAARALGRLLSAWYVLLSSSWTSTRRALSSIFFSSCSNCEPEGEQKVWTFVSVSAACKTAPEVRIKLCAHRVVALPGSTLCQNTVRWVEPEEREEKLLFFKSLIVTCVDSLSRYWEWNLQPVDQFWLCRFKHFNCQLTPSVFFMGKYGIC